MSTEFYETDSKTKKALPYSEYYAEITLTPPISIFTTIAAESVEFTRLCFSDGKAVNAEKNDVATVGVYGIGMKRAILKWDVHV